MMLLSRSRVILIYFVLQCYAYTSPEYFSSATTEGQKQEVSFFSPLTFLLCFFFCFFFRHCSFVCLSVRFLPRFICFFCCSCFFFSFFGDPCAFWFTDEGSLKVARVLSAKLKVFSSLKKAGFLNVCEN